MRLAESLGFSGKKVKPDHKYDILRDDYLVWMDSMCTG